MDPSQANRWEQLARNVKFETHPFIHGDYCQSSSRDVFQTENPATSTVLAVFPDGDADTVDRAVIAARDAFVQWRRLAPEQRKSLLITVAIQIKVERDALALLDCLEMGMPISMALKKADIAADMMRYYAESIDKVYGEVAPTDSTSTLAMSLRQP